MSDQLPILEGHPLSDEQKNLSAVFDEIKKQQLTFLDEAGKRIIELSTGLISLFFAIIAFGKDFPPLYLKANPNTQWLAVVILTVFILALLFGVLTVQPRRYDYYKYNLTQMREELEKIVGYKSFCIKIATWTFFVGTLLLAILVAFLVFSV